MIFAPKRDREREKEREGERERRRERRCTEDDENAKNWTAVWEETLTGGRLVALGPLASVTLHRYSCAELRDEAAPHRR